MFKLLFIWLCFLALSGCAGATVGKYEVMEQYRTKIGDKEFLIEFPGGRAIQYPFTQVPDLEVKTGSYVSLAGDPTTILSAYWLFPIGAKHTSEGNMDVVVNVYEPLKGLASPVALEAIKTELVHQYHILEKSGSYQVAPPSNFRPFMIQDQEWIRYDKPVHGSYYWSLARVVDEWRFVTVYVTVDLGKRNPEWLDDARAKAEEIINSLRVESIKPTHSAKD